MPRLADWWFRLKAVLRPATMERELDQELSFHLEMEARKLTDQGMPLDAAAREAVRRLGGSARSRDLVRDSWGTGAFRDAVMDVRHALRQFRRRPGFSAMGIGALGIGIAATLGLFGVIQSLLVRPLPIADDAKVRVFWSDFDWRGVEYDFLRERRRAFAELAAYSSDATTLRADVGSTVLLKGVTSSSFFDVLGTLPLMGRTFREGEDRPGAEPVAVISHEMWQRELGADPQVLSRRINLDGTLVTIVGVMPRGFYFPTPEYRLWTPLQLDPAASSYQNNGWLVLLGRVAPGQGEAQVRSEVATMATALGERFTYPAAWDKTRNAYVKTARDYLVGDVKPALMLVFGAGVLLLLIACANVAALVLARTTDRAPELKVRMSLGAGRSRVVRQILVESLTFTTLAAVVGATAAGFGFKLLLASMPLSPQLQATVAPDWTSMVAAFALAAVLGVLVALAPIRSLLAGHLEGVSGVRGAASGRATGTAVHRGLLAFEAGVAVLLVAGALLFVRSVSGLLAVDLGFDPRGVAAMDVSLVGNDFSDTQRTQLFDRILERATQLPGVSSAAWTNRLPLRDGGWQGPVSVTDVPELQGASRPNALFRPVSPDYFKTLGISVLRGRGIDPADRPGSPRVVVVDQAFADRAWPGAVPIGRMLVLAVTGDTAMVVGVAETVRSTTVRGTPPFVTWVADAQDSNNYKTLVIRSSGSLSALPEALRGIAREVDPRIALTRPTTLEFVVRDALTQPLQLRLFLGLFGALALALGMVGIYSVASYSVARRRTELGVRLAMGASPQRVRRQILREALGPVAAGTGLGLVAVVALARLASALLYGVGAMDLMSLGAATAALLVAGLLAAAIPAQRAGRVSPVSVLTAE